MEDQGAWKKGEGQEVKMESKYGRPRRRKRKVKEMR